MQMRCRYCGARTAGGYHEPDCPVRLLTKNLEDAARDVFLSQFADNDHFNVHVIHLIRKADPANRRKLETVFPDLVRMWQEWNDSPTEKEFFERYNVRGTLGIELDQRRYDVRFT